PGANLFVGLRGPGAPPATPGVTPGASGVSSAGPPAAGAGSVASDAGDVIIFTAVGGRIPTARPAASVASADPAVLADDLAELVRAFETSPTSVADLSADVVGPASVKTGPPERSVDPSSAGSAATRNAPTGADSSAGASAGAHSAPGASARVAVGASAADSP